MKLDENKLENLLQNEMNPAEKEPFAVSLPEKKRVFFPKWAGAVAACLVAAVITSVCVIAVNQKEIQTDDEPISDEELDIYDGDDRELYSWEKLMSTNLIKYSADDMPAVLASANYSQNAERNSIDRVSTLSYRGVTVTAELYDILTSSSEQTASATYAITLASVGVTQQTTVFDSDAPDYYDYIWEGRSISEWNYAESEAYELQKILTYILGLKTGYDNGNYTKRELKEKLFNKIGVDRCIRFCKGFREEPDRDNFDGQTFIDDDAVTVDFDLAAATLKQTEEDIKKYETIIEEARETYYERYAHTDSHEAAVSAEDLFKALDNMGCDKIFYYVPLESSISPCETISTVMTVPEMQAFFEKVAAYESLSGIVYGLAARYEERETVTGNIKTYEVVYDGTRRYVCDGITYLYCLELNGQRNDASTDTTYTLLSNIADLTFERVAQQYSKDADTVPDPNDFVLVNMTQHYSLVEEYILEPDETWTCNGITYKEIYKAVGAGNDGNEAVFVYLSNIGEITFEQAWESYFEQTDNNAFKPEDLVIVEIYMY